MVKMASASIKEFNSAWWAEVRHRVIGAIVFMDESIAECMHWENGLYNLMFAGAKAINLLVAGQRCNLKYKKAVFITKAATPELKAIKSVIESGDLTQCILISTISLELVYMEFVTDQAACDLAASGQAQNRPAELLENALCLWMGRGQAGVGEVNAQAIHMPIFAVAMTNVVFTTPPFANVLPSKDNEYFKEPQADLQSLTKYDRKLVRRMACVLNSMMDSMNLKEEVYYMGHYSALVAGVLENSPIYTNRRKNSIRPATLIIVDRTLDLCGVASHSSETVYDKMRSVLPLYPGRGNEVAVDMSSICRASTFNHPNDTHFSPGTLFVPDEESTARTIDHMINKTQKEVMLEVYNRLSKIDVHKTPSPENLTKVTPQSLEKIIYACKENYDVILKHLGALMQGLALVQMHKSPRRAPMELLMTLEKQMTQSLATSRESTSVLTQISYLIQTRKQRGLPLDNLIALLIHVYSLTGTEIPLAHSHQNEIINVLTKALNEEASEKEKPGNQTSTSTKDLAEKIVWHLNTIKLMRQNFTKYNSLLKPCESGDGYEYKGLMQQLVEDLVNTSRPEIPDLHQRSEGLKDLLRTGLSMLNITGKKPKHPLDNPTVMIFIIGGTNAEECKRLHRTVITSGVDNTVLFGSTRFLTPEETTQVYIDPYNISGINEAIRKQASRAAARSK